MKKSHKGNVAGSIAVNDLRANRMKVREVKRMIETNGWYLVRIKGDHRQCKHSSKQGRVAISVNLGRDSRLAR
jgi:predicted RNA binding protein YcfA (HicA-like mRNA interferase family)